MMFDRSAAIVVGMDPFDDLLRHLHANNGGLRRTEIAGERRFDGLHVVRHGVR